MGAVFEIFINFLEAVLEAQFFMRYFRHKERYNKWFTAAVLIILHFVVINILNRISFFNVYGDYFFDFLKLPPQI